MATSTTNGKISSRNPLEQLSSDVWFAIITESANGNKDFKINIDVLKQYMADTAKSAYDIALAAGFVGTEEEWLASLAGKSAYQLAYEAGEFTGTQEEWVKAFAALYNINSAVDGRVLVAEAGAAVWRQLTKDMVGLDQVDNTPDLEKPISRPTQDALDTKVGADDLPPAIELKLEALGLMLDENGDLILDEGRIAATAVN